MNLSAINFKQLDVLIDETNNIKTAYLLDKFIFWWQYSQYTLEGQQGIWFTRRIQRIADDTRLTRRTVERYLAKLETIGFIKRAYNQSNLLYIQITDKLLTLIGRKPKSNKHESPKETNDSVLPDDGGRVPPKMAEPTLYKDPLLKTNSTISDTGIVNNSDELIKNPTLIEQTKKPSNSENLMDKLIGEGITQRCANYIKAVISNVCQSTKDAISNPSKLYAEIVYAITNPEHHFKNAESFEHKMNIVSKLLRRKQWSTPKGFYNHCEAGQHYRDKENIRQNKVKQHKQAQKTRDEALNDQLSDLPFDKARPTALKNNKEIYQAKKELSELSIQIREIIIEINSIKRTNALFERNPDKSGYAETLHTNAEIKAKYEQELLELQQQHKDLREIIEQWAE